MPIKMLSPIQHLTKALKNSQHKLEEKKIKPTINNGGSIYRTKVNRYDAFRQT